MDLDEAPFALMQKKRVLLLGNTTGYQTRVFAEAAERLDLEVMLATDRCRRLDDPWHDHSIPVKFHQPDLYADVLEKGADLPLPRPDAIVAVGDRPTLLAAMIAERMGIPYNSPGSVEACRNKYLMRERFRAAGLLVPSYFRAPLDEDPRVGARQAPYPCVLKPLGLSASRGVIRANNEAEFVAAFARIRKILEERDIVRLREEQSRFIQIESFIEGREFALEGLVTDGQLQVLALFDKPDPLDGPFFEETIYVTPSRESAETQRELIETATAAVRALGLTRGPVHAEMRHNRRGAWMLEVGARPIGGLCARALRFTGGMPLEELVLRHALGEDVSGARLMDPASGVMMIPIPRAGIYEDVAGVERAREVPGIDDVVITAKQGQKLLPLPEGSSYLGFIFARGERPAEVEAALRRAHQELEFRITAALPVLAPTSSSAAGHSQAETRRPRRKSTLPSV